MASAAAAAPLPRNLPPPTAAARNPVYLHQLYRAAEPLQQQPFVRRELKFFCSTLKWSILVFLGFASFFVMMWMIFHPTFPQLNVVSAAISAVSLTATAAVAECNISFALTNPNRHLNTVYDRMEISLLYASQQVLLSQFHQPTFFQPRRSQVTFQTNLSFSGADLGSGVISAMKQEVDQGSLGFMIRISAVVKYRTGKWRTKSRVMRAYCGGVSFGFPSSKRPGIFLNPYQECEGHVLLETVVEVHPIMKILGLFLYVCAGHIIGFRKYIFPVDDDLADDSSMQKVVSEDILSNLW